MKKFSKIVLASGIVLGFSVTPELFNATQAQAQESNDLNFNFKGGFQSIINPIYSLIPRTFCLLSRQEEARF